MGKNEAAVQKKREKWVDYVKVTACVFVVLGHFFQSLTKSGIIPEGDLYYWFNSTIYCFHVQLFFICSGYLYQKNSVVNSAKSLLANVLKKAVGLGIPYFVFSGATWALKTFFSNDVNDEVGSLTDILFVHPIAPYWYLYILFFVFLITPTFANKKAATVGLCVAAAAKIFIFIYGKLDIYLLYKLCAYEFWFVLGMIICVFNVQIKGKLSRGIVCVAVFLALSIYLYKNSVVNGAASFAVGLFACAAVIYSAAGIEDKPCRLLSFLAKYTMPVFLMHTLFAAFIRVVLIKAGITNAAVHILLGIAISFAGPIVAAWIMKKIKWAEFFLYPNKFIKIPAAGNKGNK